MVIFLFFDILGFKKIGETFYIHFLNYFVEI